MTAQKIVKLEELVAHLTPRVERGRRVAFTNGCFDLLHVGHVRYLARARGCGDLLVVGLNSDASVRRIKGARRPIIPQDQRAEVLAALSCVDFVVIFEEPDPLALIQAIVPAVLVKGADWPEEGIIGADVVRGAGGRVVRVPVIEGASTTNTIDRIVRLWGEGPTGD
jgi:rfaE bifunctional protein nucleotidyltransferase chain/domain